MEDIKISLIQENEYNKTAKLIEKTCRESFKLYYPPKIIEKTIQFLNAEGIKKRASWTHFYVAKFKNQIVGCGAIGPYYNKTDESSLFTIFVDPKFQGNGIGKKIIHTLENDEFFIRAKRIEVPASFFALPFYIKCGYKHKNQELIFDVDNIKLEKFNKN